MNIIRQQRYAVRLFSIGMVSIMMAGCTSQPSVLPNTTSQSNPDSPSDRYYYSALPAATQHIDCQQIAADQVVSITGHAKLSPRCDLRGKSVRFVLNQSNTSLDCNNAWLSPKSGDETSASAITIQPKRNQAIANIGVANCHIQGYGHALHILQKTTPRHRYLKGLTDATANRKRAPQQIQVINLSSIGSKNSGIFVGDHVHHVMFDRLRVQRAGTVGVYLEFASQHNTIRNSVFEGNGFRTFKPNREAIAIDASAYNRILDNTFVHNGAGSIHLYRNCFEHAADTSRSNHFKRTQSAAYNLIQGNKFRDEPIGVWVASRQSRNLKGFECGAYPLAQTTFASYHVDSAKHNRIIGNTFEAVETGIKVEDDGTEIMNNDFRRIDGVPYVIGSEIRQKYAHNVKGLSPDIMGTVIKDNKE